MQVANLVLPWFASTTALEQLAAALESAAGLCQQYIVFFHHQCASEAGHGPKPDGPPSPALHSKVAGPLGELPMMLRLTPFSLLSTSSALLRRGRV